MGDGMKKVHDDGERSLIRPPVSDGVPDAPFPPRPEGQGTGPEETPAFVYVLTVFSALGGFLFGYDTGVVSGAMLPLKRRMRLDALWQELVVSSAVAAAALGALLGGPLNEALGRRRCILLSSGVFAVGGAVLGAAPGRATLLLGRVVVGLGIGVASMTVPVYIAEVSPPHLRGQLVTVNQLFITGGQLVASLVDGLFSYMESNGWRYMLGLSVVPALVQLAGFLFLPERGVVILRILRHAPTRRALIVGCGMQMFQQLCGINTVMYYSATILQMSGVRDDQEAIWLSSATAATNFLLTLVGVWLVERAGRRRLALGSMLGTALSLCLLALGFLLTAQNAPPVTLHTANTTCTQHWSCEACMLDPGCGFCYRENSSSVCSNQTAGGDGSFWAYNYCPSSYSWVVLLGLILYLASFAPAGVNWTCNVLVSLTFLHLAQLLTYQGVFFLYAGLSLLGVLFILGCLPETQGVPLEEVEGLFAGHLCSCGSPTATDGIRYSRVTSGHPRDLSSESRSDCSDRD
ncbi:hypothetical protein NHX12_003041 [Muraenolepis orangiensis]|uniref:Major facilitator superfamily (MFS) profile domain-containing protein n=1 Tax=Muraenolepis orangiensis TaxID=630683 RepID=A0A9Q0IDN0_9TELE|nr:hypothetical protein NHX12_003041 [Muraenolepis orangiensis]